MQEPDAEGIGVLHDAARAAVGDERARGRNLDTKTLTLTTVAGALLTLNVSLGRPMLSSDLGPVGSPTAQVLFGSACLALLVAATIAIAGVIKPQAYLGLARKDVRAFYEDHETQALSATEARRRLLGTYSNMLDADRPVNDRKAALVKRAVAMLLVGLTLIVGEAAVMLAREAGA